MKTLGSSVREIISKLPANAPAKRKLFIMFAHTDMTGENLFAGYVPPTVDKATDVLCALLDKWEAEGERENALHALCRAVMALRPDLETLSLGEWVLTYGWDPEEGPTLTNDEEEAAQAILNLFKESPQPASAETQKTLITLHLSPRAAALLKSMVEFAEDAVRGDDATDPAIVDEIMAELNRSALS